MFPLIAAIPSIISAVSKVSDLFSSGKKAVQEVTGKPSVASTPEEMQEEISQLPPAEQAKWAEIMKAEVSTYEAQTDRLRVEQGVLGKEILSKVDTERASEIAYMRQTTRPWAVRMMVWFIMAPFILIAIDIAQMLIFSWFPFLTTYLGAHPAMTFDYVFGSPPHITEAGTGEKILNLFNGEPKSEMAIMYNNTVGLAMGIILGYMGLREYGKRKGHSGDTPGQTPDTGSLLGSLTASGSPVSQVINTVGKGAEILQKVRKAFK